MRDFTCAEAPLVRSGKSVLIDIFGRLLRSFHISGGVFTDEIVVLQPPGQHFFQGLDLAAFGQGLITRDSVQLVLPRLGL